MPVSFAGICMPVSFAGICLSLVPYPWWFGFFFGGRYGLTYIGVTLLVFFPFSTASFGAPCTYSTRINLLFKKKKKKKKKKN